MLLPQTCHASPEWTASQNPADWLTATELTIYVSWRSETRRREWLAGRLAAKQLIEEHFGLPPLTFAIGRDGVAPCVLSAELPRLCLSLSHSHGLGVATFSDPISEGSAGIDVQWVRRVHPGLCRRVFTLGERRQIAQAFGREASWEGMLLLWTLKEAAIKARRATWGQPLNEIEVELLEESRAVIRMPVGQPLTAAYQWFGGWWLARAVKKCE